MTFIRDPKGLITIATEKRIDWNAIRAEYIGGATYGALSKRYGLSKSTLFKRSKRDDWDGQREQAVNAARTLSIERTAQAAADNATLAEDFKRKMLMRLHRIEAKYPLDATEVRTRQGNSTAIFKITDLTRAYKDLTDDMPKATAPNELLQSLLDLERGGRT